ncbi:MAG: M50 family metallopeptidase [Candidatus Baltobacteraceae bacterium]|jgi:regulator of sigma E protease
MSVPLILAYAPVLDGLGKVLVFLVMLSVLIVLHEGGHFLLARLNRVRVNDFAVGFGPTLLKWTSPRSGTNYRLNLLPLGGYCAMQGEDGKTSEAEQQRAFRAGEVPGGDGNFQAKTTWQRLSIVVAGPVANLILAYAILVVAAVSFGIASPVYSTKIGPVNAGSPGARAGLQVGDEIVSIDGQPCSDGEAMVKKIRASAGVPLRIVYRRHGADSAVTITPQAFKENGQTIGRIGFVRVPEFRRVWLGEALAVAGVELKDDVTTQVVGYAELISHPAEHAGNISGVIGMERAASAYQDLGWAPYLQLAAAISIALCILNLLPFPALDGGRGIFILAEMLRGRPVPAEKEALVHVTGFAMLMVLMVVVAYHDIANILTGKGVF